MTVNSKVKSPLTFIWLRRDLRMYDHAALHAALGCPGRVQPVFIFDKDILARFPNRNDRRLSFIADALCALEAALREKGGGLLVLYGSAANVMPKLTQVLQADRIIAGEDYEPGSITRDKHIAAHAGAECVFVKDHVIFSPRDIMKDDGTAFKVFTPYSKAWLTALTPVSAAEYAIKDHDRYADAESLRTLARESGLTVVDAADPAAMLEQIGYVYQRLPLWEVKDARNRLHDFIRFRADAYANARDMVAEEGTSRLSPYLRFGLISIRECVRLALERQAAKWLSELIWREFYMMILYHAPDSLTLEWNPVYRGTLDWKNDKRLLDAWKEGRTGYPIIDAAMRQLHETGWMHNRARMIAASFLTKDLQIDWRLGEEHFAQLLMDYEVSSNVGGWQWAASTGTDVQPYFRIFNPVLQSKKFDPGGAYIRRYVPELRSLDDKEIHNPSGLLRPRDYPLPIIDHADARQRAIAMFRRAQRK